MTDRPFAGYGVFGLLGRTNYRSIQSNAMSKGVLAKGVSYSVTSVSVPSDTATFAESDFPFLIALVIAWEVRSIIVVEAIVGVVKCCS